MAKRYLVIVESPGKIKKLKSILGPDYQVIASMGHITDLPPRSFGIDLDTMQPEYVVLKQDIAKKVRIEATKDYQVIYLASDPDREGEAISHHIADLIRKANPKVTLQRVTFDAITPSAVRAAFANPRGVDADLVAAQEARRLLDRLVGFPGSRFLWGQVDGKGLSAGRVQSVALRLVVERDREIETFVPREYWTITGRFRAEAGSFEAMLSKWRGKKPDLPTREAADAVIAALDGTAFAVTKVQPKQRKRKPPPPFTTSTMQQSASSHHKRSPDQTMRDAQILYENGYITYHRTDSPTVSPEGADLARRKILELYGKQYLGSSRYGAKGNAQEAHECIRPTDGDVYSDAVREALPDKHRHAADLYRLIFRRFIASQMPPAVYDEVHVDVSGGEAVFSAKGSRLAFDGFLRVYNLDEEREQDDNEKTTQLPPLTQGEPMTPEVFTPQQHFTQPPYRYSEATLIKALERVGVGRPSTFASMVGTLKRRKYATLKRRKLISTALGREVNDVLITQLAGLFEVGFTAEMETALDEIAVGKRDSTTYLKTVWDDIAPRFGETVVHKTVTAKPTTRTRKKRTRKPVNPADIVGTCPKCGKPLVERNGKRGTFVGCTGYPSCRHTQDR